MSEKNTKWNIAPYVDTVLASMSLGMVRKMSSLGLENTEVSICEKCEHRFQCYTTRDSVDGLCNIENFGKLDDNTIKQIQIAKAKRQGHYLVVRDGN